MLNYNPETVSTDYDMCDKLIFDEISLESVLDVYEREKPEGVVVSMGGQVPNNLALRLAEGRRASMLGTRPRDIDQAENRQKFSALLDEPRHRPAALGAHHRGQRRRQDRRDAGRLPGAGPAELRAQRRRDERRPRDPVELRRILERAKARCLAGAPGGGLQVRDPRPRGRDRRRRPTTASWSYWAISEHVEDAGVHSGDATLMLPPQTLYISTIRKVRKIAGELAKASLNITGPFNVQFLAKSERRQGHRVQPARLAQLPLRVQGQRQQLRPTRPMRRMLGVRQDPVDQSVTLDFDYVGREGAPCSPSPAWWAPIRCWVSRCRAPARSAASATDVHQALLHALMLATGFRPAREGRAVVPRPDPRQVLVRATRPASIVEELKPADLRDPGHRQGARRGLGVALHHRSRRRTPTATRAMRRDR